MAGLLLFFPGTMICFIDLLLKLLFSDSESKFSPKRGSTLSLFIENTRSLDHPDSYCRITGTIFRQIYLENELELYKKYVSESGDFYEIGVKLREVIKTLSDQEKEAQDRIDKLEVDYQEELAKNKSLLRYIGFGADPKKLAALQSIIDEEERKRFPIAGERDDLIDFLNEYKEYNHAEAVRYLEDLKKKLETVSVSLEEAEDRFARG